MSIEACTPRPAPASRSRHRGRCGAASSDKAALFKTFHQSAGAASRWMATFMAKCRATAGQSGHLHLSLQDRKGKGVFHDPKAPLQMSATMRHFLAGSSFSMPQLLAMISPTVNSYTRLNFPAIGADAFDLGVERRTCASARHSGSPKSQRVEYRVGAADGNPYIVTAAALGSGL